MVIQQDDKVKQFDKEQDDFDVLEKLKQKRSDELIGLFKPKKRKPTKKKEELKPKEEVKKPKEEVKKEPAKPSAKPVEKPTAPKPTAELVPKPKPGISGAAKIATGAAITIAGLGSASAKFESGGDPGRVSTGVGDPGGISYGTYQMNTKDGVANAFVKQSEWKDDFKGLSSGTPEFTAKWKEIASKDAKGFAKAQHDYIKKTHFDPTVILAKKMGYKVEDPGVADAIWSLSVQHGQRQKVLNLSKQNMGGAISENVETQIKSLYKARDEYTNGKFSKRYNEEVQFALKKSGNTPPEIQPNATPVQNNLTIPTKENQSKSSKQSSVSVLNNNTNVYHGQTTYSVTEEKTSTNSPLIDKQYNG